MDEKASLLFPKKMRGRGQLQPVELGGLSDDDPNGEPIQGSGQSN